MPSTTIMLWPQFRLKPGSAPPGCVPVKAKVASWLPMQTFSTVIVPGTTMAFAAIWRSMDPALFPSTETSPRW